jgi:hypothetical protein
MSFVDHYLPYFRLWLVTHLLSAVLNFQPLFTESLCGDQLLDSPLFSCELSATLPLLLYASFQFIVYYSVFLFLFLQGVSLPRGLCWFIPGVVGGILHDAWRLPVWSAKYLPSRFGAGVWQQWQLSCFLSITWHGEVFCGLGVQGVKVLILLGALLPPSVSPASQKGFFFMELTLSSSVP